jgi:Signal recognition particle receptor beta subunit
MFRASHRPMYLVFKESESHRTIESSESADALLYRSSLLLFVFEQVRIGSEMLYDILTDGSLSKSKGLVLVCSKSDISGKAVKPDKVQAAITKELERLRTTRGTLGMYTRACTSKHTETCNLQLLLMCCQVSVMAYLSIVCVCVFASAYAAVTAVLLIQYLCIMLNATICRHYW